MVEVPRREGAIVGLTMAAQSKLGTDIGAFGITRRSAHGSSSGRTVVVVVESKKWLGGGGRGCDGSCWERWYFEFEINLC